MSNFFGGINGVRFPEVVMNQGPLPSPGGLPAPLHDTPDGRINYNSTLLGNVVPYAYGEAGYMSSDTAYVNFPHSIQKIVPELTLPVAEPNSETTFSLSHSVDDSDIAFVMRLARTSAACTLLQKRALDRQRVNMTVEPFINLCTLNYLLAGLQLCLTPRDPRPNLWFELLHDLDRERWKERDECVLGLHDLVHIVRNLIKPFGVVRGSEKQGGQDQVGYASATWPVCFITNMVLDGKERNVNNLWTHKELPAGSDVVLRFKPCPIPRQYTLNHYYKYITKQPMKVNDLNTENQTSHVWQLVPDTFDLEYHPVRELRADIRYPVGFDPAFPLNRPPAVRDQPVFGEMPPSWQDLGYWHIGRTQVQMGKLTPDLYYHNDMHLQMRPPHLEMTFQPTWVQTPSAATRLAHMFGHPPAHVPLPAPRVHRHAMRQWIKPPRYNVVMGLSIDRAGMEHVVPFEIPDGNIGNLLGHFPPDNVFPQNVWQGGCIMQHRPFVRAPVPAVVPPPRAVGGGGIVHDVPRGEAAADPIEVDLTARVFIQPAASSMLGDLMPAASDVPMVSIQAEDVPMVSAQAEEGLGGGAPDAPARKRAKKAAAEKE